MPITAKQIINQAHILCGDISDKESVSGNSGTQSLIQLNQLVQQLNTQRLFPFSRTIFDYTVVSPKQVFTIGTTYTSSNVTYTPDIESPRPEYIDRMMYLTNTQSSPMEVIQLELSDVIIRRISPNAIGLPNCFGINPNYPFSEIYLDIAPQASSHIMLVYNKAIPDADTNDTINVPPEYSRLLVCGVARMASIRLQMPGEIVTNMDLLYKEAYNIVQQSNSRIVTPLMDMGRVSNSAYVYNAIGGY